MTRISERFARRTPQIQTLSVYSARLPPVQMLAASADLIPDLATNRLRVRVHALANPRSNEALATLCDTLNALEVRYPGIDLTLVYEGPGVA